MARGVTAQAPASGRRALLALLALVVPVASRAAGAPLARAPLPTPAMAPDAPAAPLVGAGEITKPRLDEDVRKNVWSVSVTGMRHSLKAGDGNEMLGNSAAVRIGKGYIAESWYVNLSIDVLLGPYEPTRDRQLNVDYFGTGATLWTGFSAQTLNLRSPEGGYGFALGLSYADGVGRSIGRSRKSDDNTPVIDAYVIRVTDFALLPAIFFSWLQPARPRGNTPELLATRLEGYFLTIGIAMPMQASYKAEFDSTPPPPPGQPASTADGRSTRVQEQGRLRGYSILVDLTAVLGT